MQVIGRRGFLSLLGVGAAAAVAPAIVLAEREPVRRFWQVGRNAPVGPRRYYVWDTAQDDRVRVSHRLMTMDPQANLITLKGNLTAADLERMRNASGAIVIPGDVEIEWVAPRFDWMAEHHPGVNGARGAVETRMSTATDPRMVTDGKLFATSMRMSLIRKETA